MFEVKIRVALFCPALAGVKRTATVQEAPGASVCVPQPSVTSGEDIAASGPPKLGPAVKVRLAVPVLVMVTDCAALGVPTVWLPKLSEAEFREANGAVGAAATPLPVRLTRCGLPEAFV